MSSSSSTHFSRVLLRTCLPYTYQSTFKYPRTPPTRSYTSNTAAPSSSPSGSPSAISIFHHCYPLQSPSFSGSASASSSVSFPPPPPVLTSNVYEDVVNAIGNTSLILLRGPSALTGCKIYAKAEYENPGGSVKDRAALYIVKDAEEKGLLVPGKPGVIVEGTAGNTGIGLNLVGNARGYQTIICIAESQSKEKKDTLRQGGAQLLEVPAVPFKNPNNYVHIAQRMANKLREKLKGKVNVLYSDQWSNLANKRAHIETTGPEIWAQTKGRIHAFSCAMGTGGSLTGVGEFLRAKNPDIKICLTDPCGAAIFRYYTQGELKSVGDSISEGIGQGRVTGNMAHNGFKPDWCFEITDSESLPMLYDLIEKEGLCIGTSSMINVAGAIRVAQKLGPGHTVVTLIADYGTRYASKIFNPQFLRSRNLPVPRWLDQEDVREKFQYIRSNDLQAHLQDSFVPGDTPVDMNPPLHPNLDFRQLLKCECNVNKAKDTPTLRNFIEQPYVTFV